MSVTWENPGVRPQNWNLQAEAGITHDDVPDDDRSSEPKVEIGFLSRPAAMHCRRLRFSQSGVSIHRLSTLILQPLRIILP
jgi:hypothetical protein